MTDSTTLDYYNTHATEYAQNTNRADMSENYNRFLKYVKDGATIVDIGCGGGRDLKYFKDHGYKAEGIDASKELCTIASEYSGCPVTCTDFLSWKPDHTFDAFWANASLLHLTENDIIRFFSEKTIYLKTPGIFYFSMKTGINEGLDNKGRFFTPFSEDLLNRIMKTLPNSRILDRWNFGDLLDRKDTRWETVIICFMGNQKPSTLNS